MTHRAFVYGCNGLPGQGKLRYAKDDAVRLTKILRSPRCSYEVISPDPATSKGAKLDELEKVVDACAPDDTFLFYFSGHGILPKGKLHLVWQEEADDERGAAVGVHTILDYVDRCEAASKIVVLDCCHAGAGAQWRKSRGSPVELVTEPDPENYVMLMASDYVETTNEFDEFGGSFLGDALRRALDQDFDQADMDGDRRLSLDDLKGWIKVSWSTLDRRLDDERRWLVPMPHIFGQIKGGSLFLTPDAPGWTPHGETWPDGSRMMLLPLRLHAGRALCIAQHPVTNAQYRRFAEDTGRPEPQGRFPPDKSQRLNFYSWRDGFKPWRKKAFNDPMQPVVCVSFDDAIAYRDWLNAKFEAPRRYEAFLPSSRLWQVAALGKEGYPKGPLATLVPGVGVHRHSKAPAHIDLDGSRTNANGVSDLIGNVWEWGATARPEDIWPASGYRLIKSKMAEELLGGGFQDTLVVGGTKMSLRLEDVGADRTLSHFDVGFRLAGWIDEALVPESVRLILSLQRAGSPELWEDVQKATELKNA